MAKSNLEFKRIDLLRSSIERMFTQMESISNTIPIIIGNLDYFGVPLPLVLADRYFHIPKTAFGFNVDIFRWDEEIRQHKYEVKYGRPVPENIDTNPNAIVSYKQIIPDMFIYKFQAKPDITQIDGKRTVRKEFWVKIDKSGIIVMVDNITIASFTRNQVEGPIGLKVNADGSYVIGVAALPDGMELKRGFFMK
ncbi:MAG: hypothetical protein EHM12_06740 [Dehalococcoidia bacterium]|nr:MAG: hypothetical protein EHM12_06740 [Dehalococcoidia bacterium]